MAVSSPGRKLQLTRLTATWPPKRMVRSRVSRMVMGSLLVRFWFSLILTCGERSIAQRSGEGESRRVALAEIAPHPAKIRGEGEERSPLVGDREIHVLDLEFAHQLQHGPGEVGVGPDLEVIHALQCLMVLL